MKYLSNLPARPPQPQPASNFSDRQQFIKRNLANNAERSQPVKDALFNWLQSFNSGMTKKEFTAQLCRLSSDDNVAIDQLKNSEGKRQIKLPPRQKPPKIGENILLVLAQEHAISIEAAAGRKAIQKFLSTLPPTGVYELDVNELVLNYIDYQHRGHAPELIERAMNADILAIMGLEKPIALAYHLRDTLYQIASVRAKDPKKYTITTWNYTHAWYIEEFAQLFKHYSA